jgi:hypothetical protein
VPDAEPLSNPSPIPWEFLDHFTDGKRDGVIIVDSAGNGVATLWYNVQPQLGAQKQVDAAHIVRCVNAHDGLVRACRMLTGISDDYFHGAIDGCTRENTVAHLLDAIQECRTAAREALRLAGQEA